MWCDGMTEKGNQSDGAQNQHYVPKFILRNFLSDDRKEQVSVFRKSSGKGFVTSIRNIMAERRFHEFAIDDEYLASFEGSICRIEDQLLPTYRTVVERRRLERSDEERANLAMFVAFQFIRTRQQREQFVQMEQQLKEHLEKHGGQIEQLEGYEPFTEDRLARQHIEFMISALPEFVRHIAAKDFILLSAPKGRAFYLADNPVCLHNSEPEHPLLGNIGLAVRGIEIYLPLTADLMLAAWCPTILKRVRAERDRQNRDHKTELLSMLMSGDITAEQMRLQLSILDDLGKPADDLIENFENGTPVRMDENNMDFNNSLQLNYARDYVICKYGNFKLARKFVERYPNHKGKTMTAIT